MAKYRGSEASAAIAQAMGAFGQGLDELANRLHEADRVSQINTGLLSIEKAFSLYNRGLVEKQWQRPEGAEGALIPKAFGQIDETELTADHNAQVKTVRDIIQRTTTNKDARDYLTNLLGQKAISNYEQVYNHWFTYHVADLTATSDKNILDTIGRSDLDPGQKKDKVAIQLTGDVSSGLRMADDAARYRQKLEEQINSSWAFSQAVDMAKKADYDPKVSDLWLDQNTSFWNGDPGKREAAKNLVRQEVGYQRSEIKIATDKEDIDRSTFWGDTYAAVVDDDVSLKKLKTVLSSDKEQTITIGGKELKINGDFKEDWERKKYWLDVFNSRIAQLDAAAQRTAGPDLDKLSDNRITSEYMSLWLAAKRGTPLTANPNFSPPTSITPSLAIGKVPSYKDMENYLLYNRGARNGNPGIDTTFVDSEMRRIMEERPEAFTKATAMILAAAEKTTNNPNPLPMALAIDMVNSLDKAFINNTIPEKELGATVASWITNKAVGQAVADNMPIGQGPFTGKWKTDTTEAFINDVFNAMHWNWQLLPADEKVDVFQRIEAQASVMGKNIEDIVGSRFDNYVIRDNGEVWFWYEDPNAKGDMGRGKLYRYRPEKQTAKGYEGNVPILEVGNGVTWETVKVGKTFMEKQQEALDKAKQEAAGKEALIQEGFREIPPPPVEARPLKPSQVVIKGPERTTAKYGVVKLVEWTKMGTTWYKAKAGGVTEKADKDLAAILEDMAKTGK